MDAKPGFNPCRELLEGYAEGKNQISMQRAHSVRADESHRPGQDQVRIEEGITMAGKYTPLENYLRSLPKGQTEVTLAFEEIERILNERLPSSAFEDRRWWDHEKEGNHINKRAWSNAGWKIGSLDVKEKRVKLLRAG